MATLEIPGTQLITVGWGKYRFACRNHSNTLSTIVASVLVDKLLPAPMVFDVNNSNKF